MTEVAYAVRDSAGIMIGAEGFEPMAGWPYGWCEGRQGLAEKPDTPDQVKELARTIVMDTQVL